MDVNRFCPLSEDDRGQEASIARQRTVNGQPQVDVASLSFEVLAIAYCLINYMRI